MNDDDRAKCTALLMKRDGFQVARDESELEPQSLDGLDERFVPLVNKKDQEVPVEVARRDQRGKGERAKGGELRWTPEIVKGAVERFLLVFVREAQQQDVTQVGLMFSGTACGFLWVHIVGTHAAEGDGVRLLVQEVLQVRRHQDGVQTFGDVTSILAPGSLVLLN